MAHPLDSAYRKFARARHHLEKLKLKTRSFAEANPPRYAVQVDDEGIGHARFTDVPAIPVPLSLIMGDAIHNTRSALDHVVYQLAVHNGGSGETNAFPIFEEPRKYAENEKRLLADVIPDHRTRIERMQPYNIVYSISPRGIPVEFQRNFWLMAIARLDNLDKHRVLLASRGTMPSRSPRFSGVRFAKGRWAGEGAWISVEEGAELFTIDEIEPIGDPSEVKMDPEPTFTIRFGEGEFTPQEFWADRTKGAFTAVDLDEAIRAAEQVVASFEDAF